MAAGGWVPQNLGPGRQIDSPKTAEAASAGSQARPGPRPDPTPVPRKTTDAGPEALNPSSLPITSRGPAVSSRCGPPSGEPGPLRVRSNAVLSNTVPQPECRREGPEVGLLRQPGQPSAAGVVGEQRDRDAERLLVPPVGVNPGDQVIAPRLVQVPADPAVRVLQRVGVAAAGGRAGGSAGGTTRARRRPGDPGRRAGRRGDQAGRRDPPRRSSLPTTCPATPPAAPPSGACGTSTSPTPKPVSGPATWMFTSSCSSVTGDRTASARHTGAGLCPAASRRTIR